MAARGISPLATLDTRMREAGRLRLGKKSGKAMKALHTFRATSQHRELVEQVAELYGGKVMPWNEPKANPANQWQVETEASEIEVVVMRDSLSCWYEAWSGGGCQRRCDGIMCEIQSDGEQESVECLCVRQGIALCRPTTRLSVVLPGVSLAGSWRMETKGWNAAVELPGMVKIIQGLSEGQLIHAQLGIERREKAGKNYIVPYLAIRQTALELQAGGAGLGAVGAASPTTLPALGRGEDLGTPVAFAPQIDAEDPIWDAEEITAEMAAIEQRLTRCAEYANIDARRLIDGIRLATDADEARMARAAQRMEDGEIFPLGLMADGRVQWR